jgi:hypothetical protein
VPGARYCEVCRHDFEAGAPSASASPPPAEPVAPAAAPDAAAATPVAAAAASNAPVPADAPATTPAARLNVVVVTDPSLAEDDEMRQKCPKDAPELVFPLDLDETLVGRRSDTRKIFPEIDIADPGVSHRQCKLLRQSDGSFAVLELGSANGTTLNGATLKPGLVTPVAAGDELIVGMWTRLQLRTR